MIKQLKKVAQKAKIQPSAYTQQMQSKAKQAQMAALDAQQQAQKVETAGVSHNTKKLYQKSAKATKKTYKTTTKAAKTLKKADRSHGKVAKIANGEQTAQQKAAGVVKNIGTRAYSHGHGIASGILAAAMEASGNEQQAGELMNQGMQDHRYAANYGNQASENVKNNIAAKYMNQYDSHNQKAANLTNKSTEQADKAADLKAQAQNSIRHDAFTKYPEINVAQIDPTLAMNNEKMMHPEVQQRGPQMGK